jgi:hypothetical protein
MSLETCETENIRPFLTRFAVPREAEFDLPGRYCAEQDLWVVDGPEGPTPMAADASGELQTLTRVQGEQTDRGNRGMELGTHTAVGGEQDDRSRDLIVAEMATITEVGGEKPDKANHMAWLQMATVTKVEGEGSDATASVIQHS